MVGRKHKTLRENEIALDSTQLRPSVHPTYARLLAAELKRRGFSDDQIFKGTRSSWTELLEDNRLLSLEQFRRLVRRGLELTNEGWLGLDVGRSTQISSHGPLGYAMVASPNVGQALMLVERYSELRLRIAKFTVERVRDRVRLVIEDTVGWRDAEEYISLHIVGAIGLLLETISGTRMADAIISFTYPEPAWIEEYAKRLDDVRFDFSASAGAIDMAETFAAMPCITADSGALEQAVRLCEREEVERQQEGDVARRVLDRLLERQGDYPSLSEMAKSLYMSDRTLIRKLKAQGTSYQMLLDDVRQELAVWYLRQTDLSVEAVAERLGYQDTSNFSRTCKRWFGLTPLGVRKGRG